MKQLCLLPCSLFIFFIASSQPAFNFPKDDRIISERVFIHTDKTSCVAGDTIWFKSYLFDGHQPGTLSTNLFVELVDEQARLIARQKLPIFEGATSGFFSIGDTLQHGFYFLRAYTTQMLDAGQNISSKLIAVLNIGYMPAKYMQQAALEYKIQFHPESGNLIAGLTNTIAFILTDQYGNGINAPVIILNSSTGDTIAHISSNQNGMGTFTFIPTATEKYFAEIKTASGEKKKFDLPLAQQSGILLNIADNVKGKIYLVQTSPDLVRKNKAELLGVMFNSIVFRQPLNFDNNASSGVIPLANLPAGVLHLSVVNEAEQVLAYRPVIINKTTDVQSPVMFNEDTVNFSAKAKNVFSIRLPDTTEGNFSVSVIALSASNTAVDNNSITNSVLLNAESARPAFNQKIIAGDKTQNDLVSLTVNWKQPSIKRESGPSTDNYISISGKVFKYGSKKPVTKGELLMYLQTKDSINTFLKVPVANDGSVKLEGLVFDDSARFNYQPDDKKMGKIEFTMDQPKPIMPEPFTIPKDLTLPADKLLIVKPEVKKELTEAKTYVEKVKDQYKTLEGVTVTTVKRRPVDALNKRYTSGLFSSMGNVTVLDLVNESPHGGQNIFQYLQGRVAGLRVDWRGGSNYSLTTSRAMSMTGGMIPVQIFLNELEVDVSALLGISIKDIALVKYFPAGTNTMVGFGISGKLAIYTKKIEDYTPAELGQYNFFYVEGYTPAKEFTSPDYSKGVYTNEDKRQTLYWNPDMYITSDTREVKVRFYNSDNATKFKVVIQGYTYDGRFIDFERIIE
jgi:hypothetical protein